MEPLDVTADFVTSRLDNGHVNELMAWIDGLQSTQAETIVTSAGSRWSFNNDGSGAHYLEFVDVTRREPNGRYKRVYKGKIEAGHVYHKGVTSRLEPVTSYSRWAQTPYGRKGRDKEAEGSTSDNPGRTKRVSAPLAEWEHAKTVYLN